MFNSESEKDPGIIGMKWQRIVRTMTTTRVEYLI